MSSANDLVLIERIGAASETVHRLDVRDRHEREHPARIGADGDAGTVVVGSGK